MTSPFKFDINTYHKANSRLNDRDWGPRVPHITCADGFKFSVQASSYHYCEPRQDRAWPYSEFEVGYPSRSEPLLAPYGQMTFDPDDSDEDVLVLSDVYPYVPAEVINQIVEAHGGITLGSN